MSDGTDTSTDDDSNRETVTRRKALGTAGAVLGLGAATRIVPAIGDDRVAGGSALEGGSAATGCSDIRSGVVIDGQQVTPNDFYDCVSESDSENFGDRRADIYEGRASHEWSMLHMGPVGCPPINGREYIHHWFRLAGAGNIRTRYRGQDWERNDDYALTSQGYEVTLPFEEDGLVEHYIRGDYNTGAVGVGEQDDPLDLTDDETFWALAGIVAGELPFLGAAMTIGDVVGVLLGDLDFTRGPRVPTLSKTWTADSRTGIDQVHWKDFSVYVPRDVDSFYLKTESWSNAPGLRSRVGGRNYHQFENDKANRMPWSNFDCTEDTTTSTTTSTTTTRRTTSTQTTYDPPETTTTTRRTTSTNTPTTTKTTTRDRCTGQICFRDVEEPSDRPEPDGGPSTIGSIIDDLTDLF